MLILEQACRTTCLNYIHFWILDVVSVAVMDFHQSPRSNHNSSKTHLWSQPNTSHCCSHHRLPHTLEGQVFEKESIVKY